MCGIFTCTEQDPAQLALELGGDAAALGGLRPPLQYRPDRPARVKYEDRELPSRQDIAVHSRSAVARDAQCEQLLQDWRLAGGYARYGHLPNLHTFETVVTWPP